MVKWVKIGDICDRVENGERPPKEMLKGEYPYINAGTVPSGYFNKYNSDANAVTTPSHGEGGIGFVDFQNKPFWCGALCFKLYANTEIAQSKYLFLALSANSDKILALKKEGGVPYFNRKQLCDIEIPLPSLSEQQRIVDILDKFEGMVENVEKELLLRQKQYEFYREKLISTDSVECKTISSVASHSTGLTYKPSNISESGTLVLRSTNILDNRLCFDDNVFVDMKVPEKSKVKKDDILICVRNGSKKLVGKAAMIPSEAEGMAFGAFMNILRAEEINPKYLFYVWQSDITFKQYKGDDGAPINQILNKDFDRIKIPVPPLDKQQEIVAKLDKFEEMISTLKKELELRKKQYEYYREKLLTFE